MCGIVGVIRNALNYNTEVIDRRTKDTFNNMLLLSQSRGSDSTGVFIVNEPQNEIKWIHTQSVRVTNPGKITVFKDDVPAEFFLKTAGFSEFMKRFGENTRALIGHTRAATSGEPTNNRNNHPHICGNVVGVHNGVITNWKTLVKKFNLPMNGSCDSEVIFQLMNHFIKEGSPLKDAIIETSKHLNGSYACAVALKENNGEYALFRHSAPLFIRYRQYGTTVLFASELDFIRKAYISAKWEEKHSPNYFEMYEYDLPNNYGVIVSTKSKNSNLLQENFPFKLHS